MGPTIQGIPKVSKWSILKYMYFTWFFSVNKWPNSPKFLMSIFCLYFCAFSIWILQMLSMNYKFNLASFRKWFFSKNANLKCKGIRKLPDLIWNAILLPNYFKKDVYHPFDALLTFYFSGASLVWVRECFCTIFDRKQLLKVLEMTVCLLQTFLKFDSHCTEGWGNFK